jgi:alpha-galactosidase
VVQYSFHIDITLSHHGLDLKYDNCNIPQEWIDEHEYYPDQLDPTVPGYDYGTSKTATRYNRMRDALLKQDRTIQYSLCAWGGAHVERWGNSTGHSWRMWGDILPEWSGKFEYSWGLMPIVNQAARHWNDSGFWAHNDWDMLEVGNGNLTYEESRTHFALWAAFKSPLIIGTRLEGIKKEILGILSNKELLDFNQDPNYGSGVMPFNYGSSIPESTTETLHPPSYYVGTSTKGIHLFILNSQNNERTYKIAFSDIPGLKKGTYVVRDMWTGKKLGKFTDRLSLKIKRHDTAALRITTLDHKNPHPNPSWSPR